MNILYFSLVNWNWIKQRPHFTAYYLAKNNFQVDYFSMTPLLKQKIKVRNNEYLNDKNLYLKDIFVLPFSSKNKLIKKINKMYVKTFFRKTYDYIILTHPSQYYYLPDHFKKNTKIIYDCMDNIPEFYTGKYKDFLVKEEKKLCETSWKITTSSDFLKEKIVEKYGINNKKVTTIRNATNLRGTQISKIEQLPLKHPNLMYIGTIDEWLDFESLKHIATVNKDITIYLLGPINKIINNIFEKLPSNIVYLKKVEHEEIPKYICSADIMLIPFKVNELIEAVDPVKMYEYLFYGKTVICSYWKELDYFSNYKDLYFYKDSYDFKEVLDEVLYTNSYLDNHISLKEDYHWESRIKDFLILLSTM